MADAENLSEVQAEPLVDFVFIGSQESVVSSGGQSCILLESREWSVDSVEILGQRDHKPIEKIDHQIDGRFKGPVDHSFIHKAAQINLDSISIFSFSSDSSNDSQSDVESLKNMGGIQKFSLPKMKVEKAMKNNRYWFMKHKFLNKSQH